MEKMETSVSISLPASVNGDDGDLHSIEDRTTKKVRFKDWVGKTSEDLIVDPNLNVESSWKDKLMRGVPNNPMMVHYDHATNSAAIVDEATSVCLTLFQDIAPLANRRDSASDGDINLLADDVKVSIVNGIPAISFSDRVKEILYKEMELIVIIKLLGRNVVLNTLYNRVSNLWKPCSSFHLMDIENGYYLVRFLKRADYDRVLSQGPWIIFGQYLTVQPWTKDFNPMQLYPSVVLAWIWLLGLPRFLYHRQIVEAIGGLIGKVVKLDFHTDNRSRGRFVRLAIFLNLDKPLISQVLIDGIAQRVEYEALPTVCFGRGKYGHVKDFSPKENANRNPISQSEVVKDVSVKAAGGNAEEARPEFGPWMPVERKSQRNLRNGRGNARSNKGEIKGENHQKEPLASRFLALIGEDENSDTYDMPVRNLLSVGDYDFNDARKGSLNARIGVNSLGDLDSSVGPSNIPTKPSKVKATDGPKGNDALKNVSLRLTPDLAHKSSSDPELSKEADAVENWAKLGQLSGTTHHASSIIDMVVDDVKCGDCSNKVQGVSNGGNFDNIVAHFNWLSNALRKCSDLWDILKSSIPLGNVPWVAIGDFNVILLPSEKLGGMSTGRHCPLFGDFVDKAKLHDLGFRGPPFTWHRGLLFERLDMALGNEAWVQAFPNSLVTHLPKIKFDHRSFLLLLNPKVSLPKGRPFRFLAGWVEHPEFGKFVEDNWDFSGDISNSLSMFTRELKDWNKTIYDRITSHKRSLLKELTKI
ncbi:uncharacterized protein [Gossypium hirsutum]|uniref:DUF4283 domain-containing protein n=1 Tax=Gossypium hirsutum TaxID=3635 RepID=A0ABM3BJ61_GOSHI|nr:uncharacterized protein LOC107908079 [Gossypium hirsutum]